MATIVVAFDRDDEGGEVAVADDLPKLPFGFEHAGGGPAQRHLARGPALHVVLGVADDLEVGSEASRRAALARGGLLASALRTGRARSHASGSPQGWPRSINVLFGLVQLRPQYRRLICCQVSRGCLLRSHNITRHQR